MTNVTHLPNSTALERQPDPHYIEMLEAELLRARSGETVGGVLVCLNHQAQAEYFIRGIAASWSMIGGLKLATDTLSEDMRECTCES